MPEKGDRREQGNRISSRSLSVTIHLYSIRDQRLFQACPLWLVHTTYKGRGGIRNRGQWQQLRIQFSSLFIASLKSDPPHNAEGAQWKGDQGAIVFQAN